MPGREDRQILFGEPKQTHGRLQTPTMFGMRWMLEILLQMNKCAGRLDQAFEKIVVFCIGIEPELLEHVVGFVVKLFVPAAKKCAIKWVIYNCARGGIDAFTFQIADELRNPLAFVHVGFNLSAAQMMSKPRRFIFAEGPEKFRGRSEK
jgi:hypothetical protein